MKEHKEFTKGLLLGVLLSIIIFGSVLASVIILTGIGSSSLTGARITKKLSIISNLIDKKALTESSEEDLEEGLFDGLMAALGDQYADYYTAEEYLSQKKSLSGSYIGIGVTILKNEDGTITVIDCSEGNAAEEAGILPGDILLEVDGQSTEDLTAAEIAQKIQDDEGGSVILTIQREDREDPLTLEVPVEKVTDRCVEYEMREDGIGYLKITSFAEVAYDQFTQALSDLKDQNMSSLIIDLRNNPGGRVDTACDILREILPQGLIVYTEEKDGTRTEYNCDGEHPLEIPLVVLVNENTASAAEIFTGAVQDYGIAAIVGTTTYGKGVVQQVVPFTDGSAIKMTVSKYYTPNGTCIQDKGITPDVEVEDPSEEDTDSDPQLEKALELLQLS